MSEIVRGMTVEDFARALGMDSEWVRTQASVFGNAVAELYRQEWGEEPPSVAQVINGREVRVNIYPYGRQHHLREAWRALQQAVEPELDPAEAQTAIEAVEASEAVDVVSILVQAACASWIGRDTLQKWAIAQGRLGYTAQRMNETYAPGRSERAKQPQQPQEGCVEFTSGKLWMSPAPTAARGSV